MHCANADRLHSPRCCCPLPVATVRACGTGISDCVTIPATEATLTAPVYIDDDGGYIRYPEAQSNRTTGSATFTHNARRSAHYCVRLRYNSSGLTDHPVSRYPFHLYVNGNAGVSIGTPHTTTDALTMPVSVRLTAGPNALLVTQESQFGAPALASVLVCPA